MATDPKVVILYRMAEKKNKNTNKIKPEWVNNLNCFRSLVTNCSDAEVHVFGDRLTNSTVEWLDSYQVDYHETKAHGNSETFLEILNYAIENCEPDDIVYFVEDDYIHRPGFVKILREGLARADYVSLYDHPDKYGQNVRLMYTDNSHWQYVPSTTMTFATKLKTLVFDVEVFKSSITTGNPPDHYIFSHLTQNLQRRLATPIPGYSTHGESALLSPIINWEQYAR